MRRSSVALASLALLSLLAGTALAVLPRNRPIEVHEDGYVSSQTCRSCHPGEYATWHASYHRTMTQVVTPQTALAPFDGVELSLYDRRYLLERVGDELRVTTGIEDSVESRATESRRVVLSTGSHHFQAYWLETGEARKVSLFPMAFHIPEQRWIPFDTIMMAPPTPLYRQATADGGEWNKRCLRCHATGYKSRALRPEGMETVVAEFGIACEACHGASAEHVSRNRNPKRRYSLHLGSEEDETVLHPGRLDHRRSSQVCGQCHSTRADYQGGKLRRWVEEGSFYSPGDNLEATREIIHGDGVQDPHGDVSTRFWADGEVRVGGREYNSLLRSPCFERGEMSCLSCHVMHPDESARPKGLRDWADDQLGPGMDGSQACVQCHKNFESPASVSAHTHHPADSSGSDCLNCHMPYTAWGLQKATRSHEIDSPDVAESVDHGRPNACNQCHLDKPLQWAAAKLEKWYGIAPPSGMPDAMPDDAVSAAVRWMVSGDAGQRGLIGWSMGWKPAQEASGTSWMPPYLASQLADPYPVNRYAALRSLRTLPGYEDFTYDYAGSDAEIREAFQRAVQLFVARGGAKGLADREAVLIGASGGLELDAWRKLAGERNDRAVYLLE